LKSREIFMAQPILLELEAPIKFVEIFMDNITTFYGSLNMVVFLLKQIIYFLGIMLIVENKV